MIDYQDFEPKVHLEVDKQTNEPILVVDNTPPFRWNYSEGSLLAELEQYLKSTYGAHYTGGNAAAKVQAIDSIAAAGHANGFCLGNIQKYAARQGKKKGQERADLFKIIHYALFALHFQAQAALAKKD